MLGHVLTLVLPLCHIDKQAASAKATKTAKEHAAALDAATKETAAWKAKYEHLLSKVDLQLQLKEAQVKNSMMSVCWSAHTSALTMRLGPGGGLAGSPIPEGTPQPPAPNPFSAFM